jgi:DNA-binding response OmpR family regulator
MARLLFIDTDHPYIERCCSVFSEAGHEVATADGHSACAEFTKFNPDAIILDPDLDDVNGLDLMARLLARSRRVVFILNYRHDVYSDHFLTWAADACTAKSPNVNEFAAWVQCIMLEHGVATVPECVEV